MLEIKKDKCVFKKRLWLFIFMQCKKSQILYAEICVKPREPNPRAPAFFVFQEQSCAELGAPPTAAKHPMLHFMNSRVGDLLRLLAGFTGSVSGTRYS